MLTEEQLKHLSRLREAVKLGQVEYSVLVETKKTFKEEYRRKRLKVEYEKRGNKLADNVVNPRSIARHLYYIDKNCPGCGVEMTEKPKGIYSFRNTDYTAEHIIPKSFYYFFNIPGADSKENITVACFKCNVTKGRKIDLLDNQVWKRLNEMLKQKRRKLKDGKVEKFHYSADALQGVELGQQEAIFCNHATFQADCNGCIRWKELIV